MLNKRQFQTIVSDLVGKQGIRIEYTKDGFKDRCKGSFWYFRCTLRRRGWPKPSIDVAVDYLTALGITCDCRIAQTFDEKILEKKYEIISCENKDSRIEYRSKIHDVKRRVFLRALS